LPNGTAELSALEFSSCNWPVNCYSLKRSAEGLLVAAQLQEWGCRVFPELLVGLLVPSRGGLPRRLLPSPGDWLCGHAGPFLGLLPHEVNQEGRREALTEKEGRSCSLLEPNGSPSQPVHVTGVMAS